MSQKRIVWLYDRDHRQHPFIHLIVKSLSNYGFDITVVDNALQSDETLYRHINFHKSKLFRIIIRIYLDLEYGIGKIFGKKNLKEENKERQLILSIFFLVWCYSKALFLKSDYIVVTRPTVTLAGWFVAKIHGSKFIYYPFELYGEQAFKETGAWLRMEQFALKHVDTLITQNECRAEFYKHEKGVRVNPVIVHNYKPFTQVNPNNKLRTLLNISSNEKIVVYEGYLSEGRDLDKVVLSARYLPENVRLVFIGPEKGKWWKNNILPLLENPEIKAKVIILPPYPYDKLIDLIAFSDAGIIIYDDKVLNNVYCEPGKLSDYIFAHIPIIAPDFPTIGPIITKYNIGIVFKNPEPEEIAKAIINVLSCNREKMERNLDIASHELTWEREFPKIIQLLN